jgi:hypothetical protein
MRTSLAKVKAKLEQTTKKASSLAETEIESNKKHEVIHRERKTLLWHDS